jgi:hypothetical protein
MLGYEEVTRGTWKDTNGLQSIDEANYIALETVIVVGNLFGKRWLICRFQIQLRPC